MDSLPPDDALPFDVAPAVAVLAGDQELRKLARMAAAGPFECVACGREGTAGKSTTTAVAIRARKTARGGAGTTASADRDLTLLRLAHRSCLPSGVFDSDLVAEPGDAAVNVTTGMLPVDGVPRPLLLLDFVSSVGYPAGPDGRADMLMDMLLENGMTLVTDVRALLPRAPRLTVRIRRGKLSVQCQGHKPLVEEMRVNKAPGWRRAVRDQGEVTVLAGSALGLHAGFDSLAEAVRAGQVAGARVPVLS
jgi:hypothetical protein